MNIYDEEARVLTKFADKICKNVTNISQMLNILQSNEAITDLDAQKIESYREPYEQVKQLIVILKTKRLDKEQVASGNKRPFEKLCCALKESRQTWLAEELTAELESEPILASGPGQVEKEPENELKGASSDDADPNEAQNCAGMDDNNDDQLDDCNPSEPLVRKGTTCGRDTAVVHSLAVSSDERNDIDSPPKIGESKKAKPRKCLNRRYLLVVGVGFIITLLFGVTAFVVITKINSNSNHQDEDEMKRMNEMKNELIARARGNLVSYFRRSLIDIEKMWVDPTLEHNGGTTTDYESGISTAFLDNDVILVEGDAGTGKSFFLRKIMRDWTDGHFTQFSLAMYYEFRHLGHRNSISISDLVFSIVDDLKFLPNITAPDVRNAIQHLQQTRNSSVLVILDGFDEINKDICEDLRKNLYSDSGMAPETQFKIIISARTNYVPVTSRSQFSRFRIIGFPEWHQKNEYIDKYVSINDKIGDAKKLKKKLNTTQFLNDWAVNPLYMSFLCIVFKDLKEGTELELYEKIVVRQLKQHGLKSPNFRSSTFQMCRFEHPVETYDIWDITGREWLQCRYLQDLGMLAFMMLFAQSRRKLEFSKRELHQFNISTDPISDIGYFVKVKDAIGDEEYVYRFRHTSFQEFFAAFYCNSLSASSEKNADWHGIVKIQNFAHNYRSLSDFEYFLFRYAIVNLEREYVAAVANMKPFLGRYKRLEFSISKADIKTGKQLKRFLTQFVNVTHLSLSGGAGMLEDNDEKLPGTVALPNMKNLRVLTLSDGDQTILPVLATMRLSQLTSIAFKNVPKSISEWKKSIEAILKLDGKLVFLKIRFPREMERVEIFGVLNETVKCSAKVKKLSITLDRRDKSSVCDRECSSEKMTDAINCILRHSGFEVIELAVEFAQYFSINMKQFPSAKKMQKSEAVVYTFNVAQFLENITFNLDLAEWEIQNAADISELLLNKYPNTVHLSITGLFKEGDLLIPSLVRLQSVEIYNISFFIPYEQTILFSENLPELKRVKFIGCPWTLPKWAETIRSLGNNSQKLEQLHVNCNNWSRYLNSHVFITDFFNQLINFSRPVEKLELFESKRSERSIELANFGSNSMNGMVKRLARSQFFGEVVLNREFVSFNKIQLAQFSSVENYSSQQIFIIKSEYEHEIEEEKNQYELNSKEIIWRIFRSITDTHIIINATLVKNFQIIHRIIAEKEIKMVNKDIFKNALKLEDEWETSSFMSSKFEGCLSPGKSHFGSLESFCEDSHPSRELKLACPNNTLTFPTNILIKLYQCTASIKIERDYIYFEHGSNNFKIDGNLSSTDAATDAKDDDVKQEKSLQKLEVKLSHARHFKTDSNDNSHSPQRFLVGVKAISAASFTTENQLITYLYINLSATDIKTEMQLYFHLALFPNLTSLVLAGDLPEGNLSIPPAPSLRVVSFDGITFWMAGQRIADMPKEKFPNLEEINYLSCPWSWNDMKNNFKDELTGSPNPASLHSICNSPGHLDKLLIRCPNWSNYNYQFLINFYTQLKNCKSKIDTLYLLKYPEDHWPGVTHSAMTRVLETLIHNKYLINIAVNDEFLRYSQIMINDLPKHRKSRYSNMDVYIFESKRENSKAKSKT